MLHNFSRTVSRIWPVFGPSILVDRHTTLERCNMTIYHTITLHSSTPHLNQSYMASVSTCKGASSFCVTTFLSLTPIRTCCRTLVSGSQGAVFGYSKWKAVSNSSVKLVHLYAHVWRSILADTTACFLTAFDPLFTLHPQTRHRSSNLQRYSLITVVVCFVVQPI